MTPSAAIHILDIFLTIIPYNIPLDNRHAINFNDSAMPSDQLLL